LPLPRFLAVSAIVGAHFPTEESIRFDWLATQLTYLDKWVGITGVSQESKDVNSLRIDFTKPESRNVEIDSNLSVRFGFGFRTKPSMFSAQIEQSTLVAAQRPTPVHPDDLLEQLSQVQNLVSLAAGRLAKRVRIEGRPEPSDEWDRHPSAQVIFASRPASNERDNSQLSSSRLSTCTSVRFRSRLSIPNTSSCR
jgi:ApeA N-terminal domain 1